MLALRCGPVESPLWVVWPPLEPRYDNNEGRFV